LISSHLCSRHSFNDVTRINFRFRVLAMCHLRMALMHLPTKFCANSSIQFGVIDIFRNPPWWPPPSWIFKSCKFGTFRHVNSVVLELYIKFGSNICYSHWVRPTYTSYLHLMTSRELTKFLFYFNQVIFAVLDVSPLYLQKCQTSMEVFFTLMMYSNFT